MKIFKLTKEIKKAQSDFGGYFSGNVPEYAPELLGTSSVDASQLSSAFGRTNEALQLVNSFSSNTLRNIAFVFNFSKGGAFGVYVPALDKAIKTKALKKTLENKGYEVVEEQGMMRAYPSKKETSQEEIAVEIKKEWEKLNGQGGTAIGVNASDILSASNQNALEVINGANSGGKEIPSGVSSILQGILAVYNMAATIVHEAEHTRGADEGGAEAAEDAFANWSQAKKNEQFKKELESAGLGEYFFPLSKGSKTIHAKSNNWYKKAQFSGFQPGALFGKPRGSDLKGRFNNSGKTDGIADWSMLVRKNPHVSIEKSLNKAHDVEIDSDIDQKHQGLEEQLRRSTKRQKKMNPHLVMEEVLSEFHDEAASYQSTEELLEDNRPRPLILPIRTASIDKIATLFGWYNNLDISDGSTIPGLGDRVMAWEDRDECFSQEEEWIESQPRYNPEYDIKDFYYRWIEPRFKPQLWDDMASEELSNTHPAKRFAGKMDPELLKIINILGVIQRSISEGVIKSTRLVVSEDISALVAKFYSGKDGIETKDFIIGKTNSGEEIIAIWIFRHDVSKGDINKAEEYFNRSKNHESVKEVAEKILGSNISRERAVDEIVSNAKAICKEYGLKNVYIMGTYAREIAMGLNTEVTELDFRCGTCSSNLKFGSILAKKLGVKSAKTYKKSMALSFVHKGIRVNFEGDAYVSNRELVNVTKANISEELFNDICNRDFTINMLAYNVLSGKIEDPLGIHGDLKNKKIKTLFNPDAVIESNPMVILRAIKLMLKYNFNIDAELQKAMISNSSLLFDGRYRTGKLIFVRESIKAEDLDKANDLFKDFNLTKINDLGEKKETTMPIPIKPIGDNDNKENTKEAGALQMDYSWLATHVPKEDSKRIVTASDKDADLLMELWVNAERNKDGQEENVLKINEKVNLTAQDILRLKSHGLLTGNSDEVKLTGRGKLVITTMTLSENNGFLKNQKSKSYTEILASMSKKGKSGYRIPTIGSNSHLIQQTSTKE